MVYTTIYYYTPLLGMSRISVSNEYSLRIMNFSALLPPCIDALLSAPLSHTQTHTQTHTHRHTHTVTHSAPSASPRCCGESPLPCHTQTATERTGETSFSLSGGFL